MNKEKNKKCNFCGCLLKQNDTITVLEIGNICALCDYKFKIFHIF